MPAALVKSLATDTGIDFIEAERRWKKAKAITEQQTGMAEGDGEDYWKYVAGVFKKSMGIIAESATAKEIHAAAHEAATSHLNDLPEPTEAQAKAGVYKHGHIRLHGLGISIENPKGSTRSGVDPNGKAWKCTLPAHYGYVKKTVAPDGDNFDVYIADNPESEKVFVVDQLDADTGKFDECKGILGCDSHEEAKQLYCNGFSDNKGLDRIGAITELSIDTFKKWLHEGDTMKPVSNAILETAWRDAFDSAMSADIVLESATDSPIELSPGAVGKLKQQVVEEINSFGFHSKPSSVTATTSTIQYILKGHGKQLRKGDEKYLRETIENPTEVLPNVGEPGKEYRERSVLLVHKADRNYIAIVEISPGEDDNVLWNFWKMGTVKASSYLAKFRQQKTRLLQSGGATAHIPHIPHSKAGKPEGLSGSQAETSGSFDRNIPFPGDAVNKINESASYDWKTALASVNSLDDIKAVFAQLWPGLIRQKHS